MGGFLGFKETLHVFEGCFVHYIPRCLFLERWEQQTIFQTLNSLHGSVLNANPNSKSEEPADGRKAPFLVEAASGGPEARPRTVCGPQLGSHQFYQVSPLGEGCCGPGCVTQTLWLFSVRNWLVGLSTLLPLASRGALPPHLTPSGAGLRSSVSD